MTLSTTRFEELEFRGPDRGIHELAGLQVLVLGLGTHGGGTDLVEFLHSHGACVSVSDQATQADLASSIARIQDQVPAERIHTGGHQVQHLEKMDWVVVNPAIPPAAPFLDEVQKSGVRVVTELGLFLAWAPHDHLAAVTGTNGKSTVCALVKEMLQDSGIPVELGGNFGGSLLKKLDSANPETRWIVEISSFQASRLGMEIPRPALVALTSYAPDHLDWHGDEETYFQAKINLLHGPHRQAPAVIVAEDSPFRPELDRLPNRPNVLVPPTDDDWGSTNLSPALAGSTGRDNTRLAVTLARRLGASAEGCRKAASRFRGLPHRYELVTATDGLTYINDSKATTPDAAMAALARLEGPVHWLCGGQDKGIDIESLITWSQSREIFVYPYGESANLIARHLKGVEVYESLKAAFDGARSRAQSGETVLCSPAYPSYDQFRSFEERGEAFRAMVASIDSHA